MPLSSDNIHTILDIIDKQFILFVGKTMGPEALSDSDKTILAEAGIKIEDLYSESHDLVKLNFHLGMLAGILEDQKIKGMAFADLKRYIDSGQYIPLNEREKATIANLKMQSLADIRATKNRIFSDINNVVAKITSNERVNQEEYLRGKIIEGVTNRHTRRQIAQEIGRATGDWSRNFDKSVAYISHTALNEGRASIIERRYGGNHARVYFQVQPDACPICFKSYIKDSKSGEPKVFTIKELLANGTNIGKKQADWLPTLGALHIHCFDHETDVLTNDGWKNWKDVTGTESFLSVNLKNGESEWVGANKLVKYHFKGKLKHYKNDRFDLMVTHDHSHPGKSGKSDRYSLYNGHNAIPFNFSFLKTIPNWIGESMATIRIGEYEFLGWDFVELMGWWLSEGSITKNRNRWELKISQSKKKYYSQIENCVDRCFKECVWKAEDAIFVKINEELALFFEQFGHSGDKFVPPFIKNLSKEYLQKFLDAYVMGDGSVRKGREWKGYQFADSFCVSTSSVKMAADLGEIILKLGLVPSYSEVAPKPIEHRNGTYTAKSSQIMLLINKQQHSKISTMQVQDVEYDDFVYDVELNKYHTLFVRRNGKVTLSGNCRCLVTEYPEGTVWLDNRWVFPRGAERKSIIERPKIKVVIDGVEHLV